MRVKDGIEDGYLRDVGQNAFDCLDTFQVGGVMQGRKRGETLDGVLHGGSYDGALLKFLTTVYNAMSGDSDINAVPGGLSDDLCVAAPQGLEQVGDDFWARVRGKFLFQRLAMRCGDLEFCLTLMLCPISVGLPKGDWWQLW